MNQSRARTVSFTVALILVFVVGVLTGQQFCVDEPPPSPEPIAEQSERLPRIVPWLVPYCPAADPDDEIETIDAEPVDHGDPDDALPDTPPPATAEQRQKLLGWARDQSSTLETCPRDLGETHRLAITLEIDEGDVADVSINTDDEHFASEFRTCLRERILDWRIPDDLHPLQTELVFYLTL